MKSGVSTRRHARPWVAMDGQRVKGEGTVNGERTTGEPSTATTKHDER